MQDPSRGIYVKAKAEFGRTRWSRRYSAESAPSKIGLITLEAKSAGMRSAGNPHAAFDVEGAGNVMQLDDKCTGAPVLDPTDVAGAGNVMQMYDRCTGAPVLDPT